MERRIWAIGRRAAIVALAGALVSGCLGDRVADSIGPVAVVVRKFPRAEHKPPSARPDAEPNRPSPG